MATDANILIFERLKKELALVYRLGQRWNWDSVGPGIQ